MRIEKAQERIYLTEEETVILQRANEILSDMYNMVDSDLSYLLDSMTTDFDTFWETSDDFEVCIATAPSHKTIKVNLELW